jgi:hypothetical protein
MKMLGHEVMPIAMPAASDARFKDDGWQNNFLFDFISSPI